MVFLEAIVPEETAHSFVHQLAVLGVSEIVDMNADQSAFQRLFTKEITRISDIERLCGQMEQQLITATCRTSRPRSCRWKPKKWCLTFWIV